jgi:hypothetical protein
MANNRNDQNSGLIMSDNATYTTEVGAVGLGATATKHIAASASESGRLAALDTLREEVDRLSKLLDQHTAQIDPQVKESFQTVVIEAAAPKPNKFLMTTVLDGLATALKSVASVGSAALAVKALIAGI